MSDINTEVNEAPVATEELRLGQRFARWIDDPSASVVVGIVIPAVASSLVLSGIWAIGVAVN